MTTTKDDNFIQVIYGVSHLDGVTPIQIKFNPTNRGMKIDTTTSIAFSPTQNASAYSSLYPLAKATSSANNSIVLPWVVNATTGAVLIKTT